MFEARRWLTDPKYFSPMATIDGRHIFVGDIVCLRDGTSSYEKILKFMTDVSVCNTEIM